MAIRSASPSTTPAPYQKGLRLRPPAGDMRIGLNWIVMHAGSDTIAWHNGGTGGYRTFIGMVPSRGIGVVVMTNSGGRGADDVGLHLLHAESPLRQLPNPWPGRLIGLAAAILATLIVATVAKRLLRRRSNKSE